MKLAVAARKQLPIIVGVTALIAGGALASAGSADAADHGSQIRNYPLKQVDVGKAGVSGTRVGQDEIAHQSIGQIDIGKDGVSGSAGGSAGEIKKGTVGSDDLSDDVNSKLDATGKDGVSGYKVVNAEVRWSQGTGNETAVACPDGAVALGGGYAMSGTANGSASDVHVNDNEPVYANGVATGWHTVGTSQGEVNVKTWVICAAVN
ncbi:MAG: hypothetical protein ACRDMV_03850 [Streptosporangiales bacterium]